MKDEFAYIVGIAGGSASGKTSIVNIIRDYFNEDITLISHDYYYKSNDTLSLEDRKKLNYDHPSSFETDKMVNDLILLKESVPVNIPIYDYVTHTRSAKTQLAIPNSVIIVEGILVLQNKELRDLMDLKIYVDTDSDERLVRRVTRDTVERGRNVEGVLKQYVDTVKPMHEKYVEPSKKYADLIIPRGGQNKVAISILLEHLNGIIKWNLSD